MRQALGVAALYLFASAPSGAVQAEPVGKIRICRYPPAAIGVNDRLHVPIPAGSVFVNGNDKDGDELKPPFEVHTTAAVTLPPKPGCVIAPAELVNAPPDFRLTTRYPAILPSQLTVPGTDIVGRVAVDFK